MLGGLVPITTNLTGTTKVEVAAVLDVEEAVEEPEEVAWPVAIQVSVACCGCKTHAVAAIALFIAMSAGALHLKLPVQRSHVGYKFKPCFVGRKCYQLLGES